MKSAKNEKQSIAHVMIQNSYPFFTFIRISIYFALIVIFAACKKGNDTLPPSIQLLSESGYTADSVTVPIGLPYKIGITAKKGDAAITNLVVWLTTENGTETAVDSGIYSNEFRYERSVSYGASRFEKWTFILRDKNGKSASTSVTLTKDSTSAFGPILYYSAVKLGCQGSSLYDSFLSVTDGSTYTLTNAEANQSSVNIITYWGDQVIPTTGFTLSSPGESDVAAYFPMIANWALPYNETRYKTDSLSISHDAFTTAYNDSLIISNYTAATVGKRKSKLVRPGYIIPFQVSAGTAAGKRGLIKINFLQEGIDGYIDADIKVQK